MMICAENITTVVELKDKVDFFQEIYGDLPKFIKVSSDFYINYQAHPWRPDDKTYKGIQLISRVGGDSNVE